MIIDIKEVERMNLKNPIIIEGFPGIGMIGTISTSYLADKMKMEPLGYISSSHFPPITAIHDYKPVSPARIYASEEHNLIVLFSEFVIPSDVVYPLSQKIMKFAKDKKVKEIYSLAGIAAEQPNRKIYGISSTKDMGEKLKKNGIELIKEGATQGVSGLLIAECMSNRFPAANMLIQTAKVMDPKGASELLTKLSQIIDVEINVKPLLEEANGFEKKMKDSMEKIKSLHEKYNEMGDNPMYA